ILVGRDNGFVKALAAAGSLDLKTLAPGQGLIAIVRSPLGGADGIVVVGGDDTGTLAAGLELAARLPRLWNMSGITIAGIEQQALQFLTGQRVGAGAASAVAVVVDAEKRGIATVTVRVEVPPSDAARALAALADLDAAHRRGQQPRVLNFAEVAATVVEVVAGGRTSGRAVVRRAGLNGRTLTPPIDPDELLPEPTGERGGAPAPPPSAPAKPFDLGSVYSIDGWLGDNYADLIADRTETSLIIGEPREALGAAAIATRLGLESTGVTFPLTKRDDKVRDPATEPSPILIGRTNALVQQLVKIGRARVDDLQAGDGAVQIVPRAFGNATATVVAGGDTAGADAASAYLSRRVPYVWDVARGAFTLDDVSTEVSRFLSARSGAGQAGQVVQELDTILKELKGKTIESFDAKLFLEKGDPALDKYLAEQVQRTLKDSKVTVVSQGVTDAVTVFEDKLDLPWEVDELWAKFRSDVLPKIGAGSRVDLEARLSESPEIRSEIAEKVKADLAKAGATNANVRVRSAYKQGFFWLTEQVMPDLKAKRASAVRIKVLAHKPDLSKKYKFYTVPSRWLHELFPADEIFQRDLGIPAASFTMELVDEARETYTLEALDPGGRVVYSAAFSPKFVEREYLDKFPGWSKVEVTTGWLTASIDGKTVADLRIQTDPERFWDHYQAKVLPKVYDNVMKVTGGKPTADKQPFHRDLDVEVWMSEPDFRLGIDEEQISALEALHEDLYFVTLDFFNAMGRTLVRQRLSAPGKVLPIIHPNRPGKPGQARILYAGNASTKVKLEVSYKEKGTEKPTQVSRDLSRIDATAPTVVRAIVRADRVSELELLVEAANDKEAARAADALDGLARLQASGLYRPSLSFDHVDRITVTIGLKEVRTRRTIRNTGATLPSKIRVAKERPTGPIVAWDHVIGPDEAEQIVAKLSAFPEVRAYKVGESYRGRDLSVLEVTVPTVSELVSVTKLSAYKPTIFMMGRQHANEVSSTSHLLRFAELLATDPAYREILKKVNVILCPVMNPDGAQMAFELQKLTPTYMLHAGRYSALGM
ncbi:MAG: hypothetical protein IMZ55_18300, partial [Acidobacteria bacterium]|nr:hypothetical protein [Acidobacteriota bacterium]